MRSIVFCYIAGIDTVLQFVGRVACFMELFMHVQLCRTSYMIKFNTWGKWFVLIPLTRTTSQLK